MSIRILLADDHGILRAGLRALLSVQLDLEIVGEAATSDEALRLAEMLRPDVLLLDLSMPGAGGIEVTRQLRRVAPGVCVLVLTLHDDEALLREALAAGASGYIPKRAVDSELLLAVRAVARGDLYIHPTLTRALLRGLTPELADEAIVTEELTPRETEVLRLIALGYTNRQAAEQLAIGVRTVETHRANIMAKLGLHGRVALVRYATENGLLE